MSFRVPLTELFRPSTLKNVMGNTRQIKQLEAIVKSGNPPMLIAFTGGFGSGKTTTALATVADFYASRGIDYKQESFAVLVTQGNDISPEIVQSRLIPFMRSASSVRPLPKFLVIDEAAKMSAPAQNALLRPIEEFSPITRTIIIYGSEDADKIIPPLKQRAYVIKMERVTEDEARLKFKEWATEINCPLPDDVLTRLAKIAVNDSVRQALVQMQVECDILAGEQVTLFAPPPKVEEKAVAPAAPAAPRPPTAARSFYAVVAKGLGETIPIETFAINQERQATERAKVIRREIAALAEKEEQEPPYEIDVIRLVDADAATVQRYEQEKVGMAGLTALVKKALVEEKQTEMVCSEELKDIKEIEGPQTAYIFGDLAQSLRLLPSATYYVCRPTATFFKKINGGEFERIELPELFRIIKRHTPPRTREAERPPVEGEEELERAVELTPERLRRVAKPTAPAAYPEQDPLLAKEFGEFIFRRYAYDIRAFGVLNPLQKDAVREEFRRYIHKAPPYDKLSPEFFRDLENGAKRL